MEIVRSKEYLRLATRLANEKFGATKILTHDNTLTCADDEGFVGYVRWSVLEVSRVYAAEHIALEYIASVGRGGGTFLIDALKELDIPIILNCSPELRPWYESQGFVRNRKQAVYKGVTLIYDNNTNTKGN